MGKRGAGLDASTCYAGPSSWLRWRFFSVLLGEKRATCTFLNSKTRLSCQSYSQTFSIPSCPENFTWTLVWTVDSFWGRNRNENEVHVPSYHWKRVGQTKEHQEPKQRFHYEYRIPVSGACICSSCPPPYMGKAGAESQCLPLFLMVGQDSVTGPIKRLTNHSSGSKVSRTRWHTMTHFIGQIDFGLGAGDAVS